MASGDMTLLAQYTSASNYVFAYRQTGQFSVGSFLKAIPSVSPLLRGVRIESGPAGGALPGGGSDGAGKGGDSLLWLSPGCLAGCSSGCWIVGLGMEREDAACTGGCATAEPEPSACAPVAGCLPATFTHCQSLPRTFLKGTSIAPEKTNVFASPATMFWLAADARRRGGCHREDVPLCLGQRERKRRKGLGCSRLGWEKSGAWGLPCGGSRAAQWPLTILPNPFPLPSCHSSMSHRTSGGSCWTSQVRQKQPTNHQQHAAAACTNSGLTEVACKARTEPPALAHAPLAPPVLQATTAISTLRLGAL